MPLLLVAMHLLLVANCYITHQTWKTDKAGCLGVLNRTKQRLRRSLSAAWCKRQSWMFSTEYRVSQRDGVSSFAGCWNIVCGGGTFGDFILTVTVDSFASIPWEASSLFRDCCTGAKSKAWQLVKCFALSPWLCSISSQQNRWMLTQKQGRKGRATTVQVSCITVQNMWSSRCATVDIKTIRWSP